MRHALAGFLLLVLVSWSASTRTARRAAQNTPPTKPAATRKAASSAGEHRAVVQQWMRGMTLRDKVAQMVFIHSYGEAPSQRSRDWRKFVQAVRDLKVGGVVVLNRVVGGSVRSAEPYAMASSLNRMQRLARVPLLVGGDFERGASMRVTGTAKFPHMMAFGAADDPELTRRLGLATAQEARALGIQWVYAPVADVNNNPENPIINIRSFGDDPALVSRHVRAFIEGAHSVDSAHRVLVTAKHFPGHGDTNVDSHIGLAVLNAPRERMEQVELAPFRAAAEAGVDSIMSAHMAVPAYDSAETPATVSKPIISGILREQLGFKGLIATDAMDMHGLTKQYSGEEAAARAVEAGVDVLLLPPDPEAAIRGVVSAVKAGRISQARINESVTRILTAKARVGLHRSKLVDLDNIADSIDTEEHNQLAQTVADRAVTSLKNDGALPLKSPASACYWILSESRYGQAGRRMVEEIRSRAKDAKVALLDTMMPALEVEDLWARTTDCSAHVAAAFVSVAAYRGNVALGGNHPLLLEKMQTSGVPTALVSLGNPYLVRAFPNVGAFVTTYSPALPAEVAAVKALFGEIPIRAR